MDEIQARSLEVAQKQGVTPELFWVSVKRGMKSKKLGIALGYTRLAGEYMGIKPADQHEMKHKMGFDDRSLDMAEKMAGIVDRLSGGSK